MFTRRNPTCSFSDSVLPQWGEYPPSTISVRFDRPECLNGTIYRAAAALAALLLQIGKLQHHVYGIGERCVDHWLKLDSVKAGLRTTALQLEFSNHSLKQSTNSRAP